MAFNQVSPGVVTSETDNTGVVVGVATTTGATVGNFRWGPVSELVTVSNENELVSTFAAPDATNTVDFHSAAYFLKYGNSLRVARETTAVANNANSGGDASTVVKNLTNYDSQTFAFATEGLWIAKFPGDLGNSLKVSVHAFKTDAATTLTSFNGWAHKARFNGPVGTSSFVAGKSSTNDELHIAIIDEDGSFTGTAGTVLEVFDYVSQASDAKNDNGSSNYYVDVINAKSKYIWFGSHDTTSFSANVGTAATPGSVNYAVTDTDGIIEASLTAGVDSAALGAAQVAAGFDLMEDADTSDISLLICPDLPAGSETAIANDVISVAIGRSDAVAFMSPSSGQDTAAEIKTFADALTSSSYAIVDSGRLRVYDKYNDQFINIPASSSVAGLASATDAEFGAWFSPAGETRGQLRGVTKLLYNPSAADRDTLYKAGVNPIVTLPGRGTMLFGDKTHLRRSSAFDRINVRRLFITLRKSISVAAESQLFEFNDEFTRASFISIVEPFLREIKGRRGIVDFRVVCDATNNTAAIVDSNQFVADIFIKPARSINFISLNFIATRSGVDFTEVAGE